MTVDGPRGDERRHSGGVMSLLTSDYVTSIIFAIRCWTICSCIAFLLGPIFSPSSANVADLWYRRVHLSGAASQALRLHQRLKGQTGTPSMSLFAVVMGEDSFHYLLFSLLFAFVAPVSVSIVPVGLMALLHVAVFAQKLLDASSEPHNAATGDGPSTDTSPQPPITSYPRRMLSMAVAKINQNNEPMLRLVALNEIMLMVVCIFVAFSGSRIIMLPFAYSFYLKMRYASRRNPYSRMAFAELRYTLQSLSGHSNCPQFVSRIIQFLITMVSRMAPQA